MKLLLKTRVRSAPEDVRRRFDRQLFLRLVPLLPRVKLLRFDGRSKGDRVEMELNFILFRQPWMSEIVDERTSRNEICFIDEGVDLPFFLRRWIHKYRLQRLETGCQIVDELEYRSGAKWLDWLLYPALWLQFAYRRLVYRLAFRR